MTPLRILLADDCDILRRGLRQLLEEHEGWQVVSEAKNGLEAAELTKQLEPDVVVLDLFMPVLGGLEAAREILKSNPGIQMLVLTMDEDEVNISDVLNAGIRGWVSKSDAGRDIVAAVEALSRNQPFLASGVLEMLLKDYRSQNGHARQTGPSPQCLTPRQMQILQSLAEGKSNKHIAFEMGLSIKTAIAHRTNMMRKLGLDSMSDLVRYAIRNRFIQL